MRSIEPPFNETFEMRPEEPIVQVFAEAFREVHGREPEFQHTTSITDGNVFMSSSPL